MLLSRYIRSYPPPPRVSDTRASLFHALHHRHNSSTILNKVGNTNLFTPSETLGMVETQPFAQAPDTGQPMQVEPGKTARPIEQGGVARLSEGGDISRQTEEEEIARQREKEWQSREAGSHKMSPYAPKCLETHQDQGIQKSHQPQQLAYDMDFGLCHEGDTHVAEDISFVRMDVPNSLQEDVQITLDYINGLVSLHVPNSGDKISQHNYNEVGPTRCALFEAAFRKCNWLSPRLLYSYPYELHVLRSEFNGKWLLGRIAEFYKPFPPGFKEFVLSSCMSATKSKDNAIHHTAFPQISPDYPYDNVTKQYDAAINSANVQLTIRFYRKEGGRSYKRLGWPASEEMVEIKSIVSMTQYILNSSLFGGVKQLVLGQTSENAKNTIDELD